MKLSCTHGFLSIFSFQTTKEDIEHAEGTSTHRKSIVIIGSIDKVNLSIKEMLYIPVFNCSMQNIKIVYFKFSYLISLLF